MNETMLVAFEKYVADRRARGQMPTWFRRRDLLAEYISSFGGTKMSSRTMRRIRFVRDRGIPALMAAVDNGTITIAAAAELARLGEREQERCVANPALRKIVLRVLRGLDEEPEGP